ncbi:MAG: pilin [Patescibacteria group bacterium]|jgi:hypothetical protein|nr:pilin [Patescibacteria group bacterium]
MNITKKKILSFIILVFTASLIFVATPQVSDVQAQSLIDNQVGFDEVGDMYGGENPEDIRVTVLKFIELGLTFLSLIFLVLVLYAGFQWMTSGGNEEKVGKSKKLLINAVIGLAIVLSAWVFTRYLIIMFSAVANDSVNYTEYVY